MGVKTANLKFLINIVYNGWYRGLVYTIVYPGMFLNSILELICMCIFVYTSVVGYCALSIIARQLPIVVLGKLFLNNLSCLHLFQFIRDELKYVDGFDRHARFHGSDDYISVDELWKHWTQSAGNSSSLNLTHICTHLYLVYIC